MTAELSFETLVSLCKRRGFVFPSSEIYGGIGGFWDYGPLGVEEVQVAYRRSGGVPQLSFSKLIPRQDA